ncbi:hypothetical protein [Pseudoalteromonas piscicida]|uniref:hypothetical protein n=1 Tax=Pseudoalteromonas piscicida TaxID=43662 RepID=UPI0005FA4601|nr:hypothetical protein [Pseudoalteromonas piscicida]KJY96403.1 hypothetical protein TW73_16265 [Pseudoalteromonas piscicida]
MKLKFFITHIVCCALGFATATILFSSTQPLNAEQSDSQARTNELNTIAQETVQQEPLNLNVRKTEQLKIGSDTRVNNSLFELQKGNVLDAEELDPNHTQAQLLHLARDIGLDSDSFPDLASYTHRDISNLVEQRLLSDLNYEDGDIYAQLDNIERYLEEQASSVSITFFSELLEQTSQKDELTQSFAIHLLTQSAQQFEEDKKRTSELVNVVSTAKHSESELVRLGALQSLSVIADKDQLENELKYFEQDNSEIVQAKLTLLRFEMALMNKLKETP